MSFATIERADRVDHGRVRIGDGGGAGKDWNDRNGGDGGVDGAGDGGKIGEGHCGKKHDRDNHHEQ